MSQEFKVRNAGINGNPVNIWNVVAHFTLIDKATGAIRNTADVHVDFPSAGYYESDFCWANLPCDVNHDYNVTATVTFDY